MESLICNLCLNVAARTRISADRSLRYTSMLPVRYATNNNSNNNTSEDLVPTPLNTCFRRPQRPTGETSVWLAADTGGGGGGEGGGGEGTPSSSSRSSRAETFKLVRSWPPSQVPGLRGPALGLL